MVTLNIAESDLQVIFKALTEFYFRKPFNPSNDDNLRRLYSSIKALAGS